MLFLELEWIFNSKEMSSIFLKGIFVSILIHFTFISFFLQNSESNRYSKANPLSVDTENVLQIELIEDASLDSELQAEPAHSQENHRELLEVEQIKINENPAEPSEKQVVSIISKSAKKLKNHLIQHIDDSIRSNNPSTISYNSGSSSSDNLLNTNSPTLIKNPAPIYPDSARRLRKQGIVILTVKVDTDGTVSGVLIKQTSECDILDAAALKVVKTWLFKPALLKGIPVTSEVNVPIKFELK